MKLLLNKTWSTLPCWGEGLTSKSQEMSILKFHGILKKTICPGKWSFRWRPSHFFLLSFKVCMQPNDAYFLLEFFVDLVDRDDYRQLKKVPCPPLLYPPYRPHIQSMSISSTTIVRSCIQHNLWWRWWHPMKRTTIDFGYFFLSFFINRLLTSTRS